MPGLVLPGPHPADLRSYIQNILSKFLLPDHVLPLQDQFVEALYFLLKEPLFMADHEWVGPNVPSSGPAFAHDRPADFQKLQVEITNDLVPDTWPSIRARIRIDHYELAATENKMSDEAALVALYEQVIDLGEKFGFEDPDYDSAVLSS